MNVFALFVILLSCFSRVFAESHAARTRKIIAGDHHAVNEYCYRSKDHVAYYYGKTATEACARHKEKIAQEKAEAEVEKTRVFTCRKAAGCGSDDFVSCSEEVLRECEDKYGLSSQEFCSRKYDEVKSIDAMSNWLGPLKWFLRYPQENLMNIYCYDSQI